MKTLPAFLGLVLAFAPFTATAQVQSQVASNTAFALNLYGQLAATNQGNLFFSPYSISTCLAMLYDGARGNTELQMSQVLGFGTNQPAFAGLFGQLQAELETDQQTTALELDIANGLWAQEGFPFLPAFIANATGQYQAPVSQVDFVNDSAAVTQTINDWVAQATNQKIQDILPAGSLDRFTRLVLANAVYFLGAWTEAFAVTNTRTEPFYISPNQVVQVPLMHQPLPGSNGMAFNYMSTWPLGQGPAPGADDFQALELPYASNQVSMLILLPAQVDGLAQLEQQLSPALLSNVLARMQPQPIEVFLPRFTLEYGLELNNTLSGMGMPDLFTPGVADLSGIDGTNDLYVSHVFHKAWARVDESGTEAAAATAAVVGITAIPMQPPVFRATHPFVFFIRDTQTGSLLFAGRVVTPTAATAAPTPALTLKPSAGKLTLTWPVAVTNVTLESSEDLATWTVLSGAASDGANMSLTITPSPSRNLFFRLRRQ